MAVLDPKTVVMNCIYINSVPMEEDVFAYVRFLKDGEIGFSVLDHPSLRPDFSQCGVFWVKPEDFLMTFDPFDLNSYMKDLEEYIEELKAAYKAQHGVEYQEHGPDCEEIYDLEDIHDIYDIYEEETCSRKNTALRVSQAGL